MPHLTPTLAKLTPPRLYAVTRRDRLFSLLDEHYRHHPLVWVAGPPGAGKTSLIASYLAEQKHRTLWYHVDPGDADLATFFHYLAQAAQASAGRKQLRLPALTPEFMADVPGFTRRFLRELWTKVPLPATLVLDNYQDLPDEAALHAMLPIVLAELPTGATLVVISRKEPPSNFARELAHKLVGLIRWEGLRLTLEETRTLASSVPDVDQSIISSLHATTNGWMAGTILMLERMKTRETWNTPAPSETKTEIFHYFAQQVFMDLDSSARDVLMRTALLPWMTGPMAEEVSGNSDAAQIIRELYERGLFVDRRADTQVRYQYHDLFREFLLDRCHEHFDNQQLASLKRHAAQVAERYGQQDTAVTLYAETHSWDELTRLTCELGEALLSHGRYQTLQKYVSLVPPGEQQHHPWLLYWSGMSQLVFDPVTARIDLEAAYYQFEGTGNDLAGQLLSASSVIESYYCCGDDMAPTIGWGDRLHKILQHHNGFPSQTIEAKVLTNLQGLIFACPYHPLIQDLEKTLDQTLHALDDPASRVGVATTFMNLMVWRGHFSRLGQLLDDLTVRSRGITLPPINLLTWKIMEAHHAWGTGNWTQAKGKLNEASEIVETFGMQMLRQMVRGCQLFHALTFGNYTEGEKLADLLSAEIHLHSRLSIGQGIYQRAGLSLIHNDISSALAQASLALETTAPLTLPFFTCNCHLGLAKVLIELGRFEDARTHLSQAIDLARVIRSSWLESHGLLAFAYSYLREGQAEQIDSLLRAGLDTACRNDYVVLDFWWRPKVMAGLLAHALESDIEVEYVRSVIRRRDLRAPSAGVKHWPYPVKIATLGRFEVAIDDVPLTTTGKTQRKPLELLKYLCVAGLSGANQELIEEALWPEADGEAADQSFRTTLHRLRKLLRHDDAVQLSDGHISLDLSLVSLDHMVFEHRVRNIDPTDPVALEQTLALYHGHFLQGETASWALPVRERLRALFLSLTEQLGILLEERGEVGEATQNYLRALEVEPVAEVMCRRVMMTYVRLGRRSEAIGVYQRFSQALQTKLGVPPTPETVSLYHNIM